MSEKFPLELITLKSKHSRAHNSFKNIIGISSQQIIFHNWMQFLCDVTGKSTAIKIYGKLIEVNLDNYFMHASSQMMLLFYIVNG